MTVIRHPNNQGVTLSQWRKTAAGGETSVSGTDDFSAGLAYTAGAEQVFVNGVLLERGVDYTASTGTTVTGLTALVAGDIVTVSSPSAFNVANAIPKATITAKGDLLVGTGASTPTNLGVGADGQTLVANSSAATGLSYQPLNSAGKNAIINGGMDIWQRGTSGTANSSAAGSGYNADRWQNAATGNAITVARYATSDTTNLPFIQYCARVQRNSGQTGTSAFYHTQAIETINSIPFVGKTVTVSFYARAGANYSAASSALGFQLQTGTGTDQNIFSMTGAAYAINSSATLTSTWQRFTFTTASVIATSVTQLGLVMFYNPVGTAGANDYYEVTGVQLELGSVATNFSRAGGSIGGELALCQRYYQRFSFAASNLSGGFGTAATTTSAIILFPRSVSMRVTPTSIENSTLAVYDGTTPPQPVTLTNGSTFPDSLVVTASGSGLTAFRPYFILGGSGASYVGFTAEL